MGTVLIIFGILVVVAGFFIALADILEWSKRRRIVLIGLSAIVGIGVVILGFWLSDRPVTEQQTQEIVHSEADSLRMEIADLRSDMDSLIVMVKMIAGQSEPDSSLRTLAYELADRLDGIVKTALDKGIVAIGLEKYDEALIHLDHSLEAASENLNQRAEVFFYMGIAHDRRGEDTLAFNCFDSSITYNPQSHKAWFNRGYALDELGRYEEAIASYKSALTFKTNKHNMHRAWNNIGATLMKLGRDGYEEAVVSYDSALAYKHGDQQALYNRGNALHELGRYKEAIASYDSALACNSDDHEAWFNRGNSLMKLIRYEDAIVSFDSALAHKSDWHEAWFSRGIAYSKLGSYEEAIASYDSALTYKHDKYQAWGNRAASLANLNRFAEALSSCDSALKYAPGDSLIIATKQLIMEMMHK